MGVWSVVTKSEITKDRRLDGEYFHPNYLKAESIVLKTGQVKPLGKLGDFIIGPFGSAFHVTNYDSTSPYRYVRGKDVKPFAILNDDNVYMPEKDYRRLSKYALQKDDLLISVVGTLGNVAIVPDGTKGIFSCKSTVFRNSTVNPYYLLAYFNSIYGKECLLRRQRGAIQTGLNKEDLKTVPVPLFLSNDQIEIGSNIKRALELSDNSQALYSQAQELLERDLKLDKLIVDKPLSYETRLADVVGNNRADAEYFHAKYKPLLNMINSYSTGFLPLSKIVSEILPNIDLRKATGAFDYIEIGDIAISDGSYQSNRIQVKDLPANAKIKLRGGELVISQVRPTRGAISIISDSLDYPTLCSGAFFTCHVNDLAYREIIWLYIRSIKWLFEKFCGGTSYPTIDSHYLKKLPVPQFERKLAENIRRLIIDSKKAKTESQLLLEQAKSKVEKLIEEAAQK